MRYKIMVGNKTLCPAHESPIDLAEAFFSLVLARHHNAKLVVLR